MDRTALALVALALLGAGGLLWTSGAFVPYTTGPGYQPSPTPSGETVGSPAPATEGRYEMVTVTVYDENGTVLGEVRAAVADTPQKRYTGLSDTESLPEDRGMLFTYGSESNHTYVMREMDFGLDIVYVGANGTINTIHHAPEPPEGKDGEDYRYPGYGQYVLEVNYEWTTRHGVAEGDRIEISGLEE